MQNSNGILRIYKDNFHLLLNIKHENWGLGDGYRFVENFYYKSLKFIKTLTKFGNIAVKWSVSEKSYEMIKNFIFTQRRKKKKNYGNEVCLSILHPQ